MAASLYWFSMENIMEEDSDLNEQNLTVAHDLKPMLDKACRLIAAHHFCKTRFRRWKSCSFATLFMPAEQPVTARE
jgi:hypothetical protein